MNMGGPVGAIAEEAQGLDPEDPASQVVFEELSARFSLHFMEVLFHNNTIGHAIDRATAAAATDAGAATEARAEAAIDSGAAQALLARWVEITAGYPR